MKKIYAFITGLFISAVSSSFAQSSIEFVDQIDGAVYVNCNITSYDFDVDDIYTAIHLHDGTPLLQAGSPDVEKLTTAIIVDDTRDMQVEILHAAFEEFTNVYMHPSKGNLLRTIDPNTVPYNEGAVYSNNSFFPGALAGLGDPFIQHQYRGQSLHFFPVQYNPITHVLRIYSNIEVAVVPTDVMGENPLPANVSQKTNATFREVFADHFLNYTDNSDRYDQIGEIGNMLVITDAEYLEELEPWIQWKREKGIEVEVVDVAGINSINAISTYVENYYNDNGLTYLVLVGDENQIPVQLVNNSGGQGYCDACYGYISGNDNYSEIFIGHLLVHNDGELPALINKILEYEKTPATGTDWFSKVMCIGSNEGDGIGDDDEADWQHENNIKSDLLDFTYTEVWEKYDGTHGTNSPTGGATADQTGAPSAASLTTVIEDGCSLINYTGHGAHNLIVTGSYTNNQINALQNNKFYPFFIVVGCCVGDYDDDDASGDTFGEAWIKSPSSTTLTGGIGGSFSSVYQSWAPPMEGQDEMNKIIANLAGINTRHTMGSIHYHGCASMNDVYGAAGDEMTDTWILMGDPSVQLRTAMPTQISVNHPSTGFIGLSTLNITCNTEDALIALTIDGEIISTGLVSGGQCSLSFDAVGTQTIILLTATSFNTIPYQGTIELVPAQGPYVVGDLNGINDGNGNANGLADYFENVQINASAENIGAEVAGNVNAVVTCDNPYIIITDNTQSYGSIPAGSTVAGDNAFSFYVDGVIEDLTNVVFVITYTDDAGNTWTTEMTVVIHAPSFVCTGEPVVNEVNGNNNGQLDNSETLTMTYNVVNSGSSATNGDVNAWLSCNSSYVTIEASPLFVGQMAADASAAVSFTITVAADAPSNESVIFNFSAGTDSYASVCNLGRMINPITETWETGDDSLFPWTYTGSADWFVTENYFFEGYYSMQSGSINNSEQTTLNLSMTFDEETEVSFMYKVSSEESYDFLTFYLNTTALAEWSGVVDWTEATFTVPAGTHTLRWRYEKDPYVVAGLDAAWVDNISFSPEQVVDVKGVKLNSMISVFPNPADDQLNITFSNGKREEITIEITNALGQIVYNSGIRMSDTSMNNFMIPIENLEAGLYHLNVVTPTSRATENFVKR